MIGLRVRARGVHHAGVNGGTKPKPGGEPGQASQLLEALAVNAGLAAPPEPVPYAAAETFAGAASAAPWAGAPDTWTPELTGEALHAAILAMAQENRGHLGREYWVDPARLACPADLSRLHRIAGRPVRAEKTLLSATATDYRSLPIFRGTVRAACKSAVTHIGVTTARLVPPVPDLDLDGLFRAEDTIDFPGAS